MQSVFKLASLSALDEFFDGSIVIRISWLEAQGIMKDEPLIDRGLEPLLDICFSPLEIGGVLRGS